MIHTADIRNDVSEHKLQMMVLAHVRLTGKRDVEVFAVPNAARRSMQVAQRMKAEGMKPGVADLVIMLPRGLVAWLELKTPKGRQSIHQKGFEATCTRLGHPYCLARTFDEAIEFLRIVGALR